VNTIDKFSAIRANIFTEQETEVVSENTPVQVSTPGITGTQDAFQTFEQQSLDLNSLSAPIPAIQDQPAALQGETIEAASVFDVLNTDEVIHHDWSQKRNDVQNIEQKIQANLDPEYAKELAAKRIQKSFQNQFGALAADEEKFHSALSSIYGSSYSWEEAEALRQKALAGDYSWLPEIRFVSDKSLQGTDQFNRPYPVNGLFVDDQYYPKVYLSDRLLNNPEEAAKSFTRAAGLVFSRQMRQGPHVGSSIGDLAGAGPASYTPDGAVGNSSELFRTALAGEPYDPDYFAPEVKVYFSYGTEVMSGYYQTV
jgi:hypothetical protein